MGTRSLTVFLDDVDDDLDDDGIREIAVMYRHYDGYISEHGLKLRNFLASVDGVSNGMGCLAAQAVMHFKSQVQNYDYEAPRQWNAEEGIVLEAYFAGSKEYTFEDKHWPAVPDELIHKGLVAGGNKWTLKALEAEDKINKRRNAEWEAQQEMKQ